MRQSYWALTPQQSAQAECARRGTAEVIRGCVDLLTGGRADASLILALGGPPAERILDGRSRDDQDYWLRVWAARGLLWTCGEADDPDLARVRDALRHAMHDPAWRVREMACKVVARHTLGDLLAAATVLRGDPVPRVSAAADRAVTTLTRVGA